MRSVRSAVLTHILLLGVLAPARAQQTCEKECGDEVLCESEVADCFLAGGRSGETIERLKPLVRRYPDNPAFARMLARAYLADGNSFWAQRTLLNAIEADSRDCESLSWLAWVHITQGDLDLAREVLSKPGCPTTEADKARWRVLEAFVARTEKNEESAVFSLERFEESGEVYPEDREAWLHLRRLEEPGWIEPIDLRAEILGGYTSNARAGSPTEVTGAGPSSALGRVDLFGRFVVPASRTVRPAVEGGVKGHGLLAGEAQELSYLDLSTRPAVIFGGPLPRLLLGYKANLLLLGLKEKELYYEAHRGELELEAGAGLLAFFGGGRRLFREDGRTRTEFDEGIGGAFPLGRRLRLMAAVSLRQYDAVSPPYDQYGATGLLAGRVTLGAGYLAGLGVTLSADEYPNSGGEQGRAAFGTDRKRSDVMFKATAEAWTPPWHNLRLGLRYELALRDSTADEPDADYDYDEHRIVAGIRWAAELNPGAPGIVSSRDHVELDYGISRDSGTGMGEERIQDLLRQDEAARAGSACVN